MNISDDLTMPESTQGTWLTANAFGVLRQQPLFGRDFVAGDERRGAEPVVIIGHRIWTSRYGSDPNVLGRSLRVNGQQAVIVGVMPEGMRFPDNTDVWAVFVPTESTAQRSIRPLRVFGRLAEGVSARAAQAEVNTLGRKVAAAAYSTKEIVGVRVEPLNERFVGGKARTMGATVMVAVGFVLLIACTNVANLLLSRSAYRAREIAVRIALGATRWRVVRQLLLESVVLGIFGGTVGLILAAGGATLFETAMQASDKPSWMVFTVDRVVVAYVAGICVLTAVLFGLAPALQVSRANNYTVLKEGGRGMTASRRLRWFSGGMVVAELALTIVLLAGAGLLIRSLIALTSIDIGIDTAHLTTMRVQLPETKYATADARRAFFDQLEPRLGAIPGIESSAVTTGVPPFDGGERLMEIEQFGRTSEESPQFVSTVTITPRFFEVMGRPVLRGRAFRDTDGAPGSTTVIVNERLAARFFPGEDPISRRIRFTQRQLSPGATPDPWRTIVGISPPIRHGSPQDAYVNAVVYIPYRTEAPSAASLVVRSALPPASIMEAVRREVQAIDRDQPVFTIQTVEQLLAGGRWPYRIFGSLFAVLALIALVLSCVALYAVTAYSVTQRTQEIGLRMALGAQRNQVSRLILNRGLIQLAIGLPFGLAGAMTLGKVLQGILVDLPPADPLTFAAITILLTVVSLAACLVPARRATHIDPVDALRAE